MKDIIRYVAVLALICATSSGLLAFVNQKTLGPIAAVNRKIKADAIRKVLASAVPDMRVASDPDSDCVTIRVNDSETGKEKQIAYYRVRSAEEAVAGYAVQTASFIGYSGGVSLMVGITPEGKISGTYVLDHRETPGLGAKIKDQSFAGQFVGISRSGQDVKIKKFGGAVEAVTGASISSHAVTSAINEALKVYDEQVKGKQ